MNLYANENGFHGPLTSSALGPNCIHRQRKKLRLLARTSSLLNRTLEVKFTSLLRKTMIPHFTLYTRA